MLKIPFTTLTRSVALKRPSLGIGGSTLPMQFARVIYNTPPSPDEGGATKLKRKLKEWWLAPVIYRELTRGGDTTPLKQWAANHIWLAQRTGGAPLHGVEITSRVVFGKEAKDLTIAEQFVLASAVNKPIILLPGSDKLNEVRLDRWRYITEVRARICAEKLIASEAEQRRVIFDLVNLAGGPPDPRVKPKLQEALEAHAPALAQRARANPMIRANALLPAARFGLREEMKQAYGFGWREHVRGVTTTLDVVENLALPRPHQGAARQARRAIPGQDRCGLHARPGQGARRRCRSQDAGRDRRGGQRPRRDRALFRGRRDGLLLRLAGRAQPGVGLLRRRARGPHDRLHGQDAGRHRHRQRAAATGPTRSISTARRRRTAASRAATRAAARRCEAGARSSPSPARSTTRSSGARRSWARRACAA